MTAVPLSYKLETERLVLRSASQEDVDLVWKASMHEGFTDGMAWDPPETKNELVEIANGNIANWCNGTSYTFTVIRVSDGIAIGRVGSRQLDDENKIWNIGFWVIPEHWGNGYAVEASKAVIEFGFNVLNVSKIVTAHATWNTQSKRVIEKLRFMKTGVNRCGFYKHGNPVEEIEYEITANML